MKNPSSPKERNLLKGAIRRVFSRSELRQRVLQASIVPNHKDPTRSKVKTWCKCSICGQLDAKSYMQVDHTEPLVPLDKSLEEMSWDEVVDNTWCAEDNLKAVCKPCHKEKTKLENKERKRIKKWRAL